MFCQTASITFSCHSIHIFQQCIVTYGDLITLNQDLGHYLNIIDH